MSKTLHISDSLSLPLDAATQTFAFIARKGAGKTYAAGKLAELLLDAGVQVVILDTVGNWYGLRISADGKGKGYDVPVFGGLRGDIPMQVTAAELVADVAVDTGRSMILDLSQFSLADRKRFAVSFGERLWKNKKAEKHPSPLFMIIEESQLIVPQQVTGGGDTARMVGIYEEIIRLGRNYGIGCAMISQRPQSVNKEVLNQTECLFVLQVNGAQERKALREWITHQGMDPALLDELPSLPIGTAYVWSPQWLGLLRKVKISPKKTFDASATPKVGDKTVRRNPAPLDLGELEKRMAATIEKAKAEDPRELQREIAALKKEKLDLLKKNGELAVFAVEVETKEVPVLRDAQIARLEKWLERVGPVLERILQKGTEAVSMVSAAVASLRKGSAMPASTQAGAAKTVTHLADVNQRVQQIKRAREMEVKLQAANPAPSADGDHGVTRPQQRILDALADLEALGLADLDKSNVAVFADQSPRSSGFQNNLGSLRSRGLIHYPQTGRVALTDDGRAMARGSGNIATLADLHQAWFSKLPNPKVSILKALIEVYPESLEKNELAERSQQSATSSGFQNNLGNLRSLGLVDYPRPGVVVATHTLFPAQLSYS